MIPSDLILFFLKKKSSGSIMIKHLLILAVDLCLSLDKSDLCRLDLSRVS